MLHTATQTTTAAPAPALPPMGPGLVLRVLSKRPRPARAGAPGPLTSSFTLPAIDAGHVARYCAALGFVPGAVPLTWWYLPVQRAHMATMLTDAFPYRLAGIVHVENELEAHAAPPLDKPIRLDTRIEILPPTSSGAVYCALETTGSAAGERIFTCTSKYLAVRGQRSGKAKGSARVGTQAGSVIDSWNLASSSGRAYARVSGDWNPIHLTRWSARLMGLPAPIIHGMHTVAKAGAALERASGRRVTAILARFRSPLALGTAVEMHRHAGAAADGEESYAVAGDGMLAVEGSARLG